MWSLDAKTLFVFYWRWNQGLEDSLGQEGALLDMTTGMFSLVLTLIFLLLAYGSPRCPADPLCEPVITPRAGNEKGISPLFAGDDRLRDTGRPCMKANLSGELRLPRLDLCRLCLSGAQVHYHWRLCKLWNWPVILKPLHHKATPHPTNDLIWHSYQKKKKKQ